MTRNEEEFHDRNPHPDERYESIINDSLSTAGEKMGISVDMNTENFVQPKNPFHLQPKQDKAMKRFSKFFDGEK
ncbi:hypothetical protein [Litchfieldia alkalitelluris]|uniref:hypothetical protein n=1 Tax=Litchfieldia alkalitelluris TaxID=304268 RepID=UPI000997E7F9|nr:hypothetical protein [Litchfieldia alkalitelluris]